MYFNKENLLNNIRDNWIMYPHPIWKAGFDFLKYIFVIDSFYFCYMVNSVYGCGPNIYTNDLCVFIR